MASASASGKFFLRDTARNSKRARQLHLARSCSQSQRGIWFILPAHGTSHIIKYVHVLYHTEIQQLYMKYKLKSRIFTYLWN